METPNNIKSSGNLQAIKKTWVLPTIEIISVEGGIGRGTEGNGGSDVS